MEKLIGVGAGAGVGEGRGVGEGAGAGVLLPELQAVGANITDKTSIKDRMVKEIRVRCSCVMMTVSIFLLILISQVL
ncbi:MAG: hypothetical protein Q7J73_00200 [Dehalococcoidales bacterium]|nr:hypothetical protein [Dehalococcoidales bacterium]